MAVRRARRSRSRLSREIRWWKSIARQPSLRSKSCLLELNDRAIIKPRSLAAHWLAVRAECSRVPRSSQSVDRGRRIVGRISPDEHSVRLLVDSSAYRLHALSDTGGLARGSVWAETRADPVGPLVGSVHSTHGSDSDVDRFAVCSFDWRSVPAGGRRSDHVSGLESIRLAVDTFSGARRCEWMDIRGSWRRVGALAIRRHLYDGTSRMAFFLLGLRAHRVCRRGCLVSRGTRHTRAASERVALRTRDDRRGADTGFWSSEACSAKVTTVGVHSDERQHLARHAQLFLLRLRGLDIFRVVLSIPEGSARIESEGECVLRNAALYRDGHRVPARRKNLRHADPARRPAHRAMFRCGNRGRARGLVYRIWFPSGQRAARQRSARRRSGCALSVAEFVLGCECRHRRPLLGLSVWFHEHGRANRRSAHRFAHSVDCCPLRLDCVFYGSGRFVWRGRYRVVSRES